MVAALAMSAAARCVSAVGRPSTARSMSLSPEALWDGCGAAAGRRAAERGVVVQPYRAGIRAARPGRPGQLRRKGGRSRQARQAARGRDGRTASRRPRRHDFGVLQHWDMRSQHPAARGASAIAPPGQWRAGCPLAPGSSSLNYGAAPAAPIFPDVPYGNFPEIGPARRRRSPGGLRQGPAPCRRAADRPERSRHPALHLPRVRMRTRLFAPVPALVDLREARLGPGPVRARAVTNW